MFDIIPWFDETYIVEMGRLFLCGGDPNSILLSKNGVQMVPIHYFGPLLQEMAFRLGGQLGVRLSSLLGAVVLGLAFRAWCRGEKNLGRLQQEFLGCVGLTVPLVMQSVFLARPDAWSLAFCVLALVSLGRSSDRPRSVLRLATGAFFAVLSVFTWPSAVMTALIYPACCFSGNRKREFLLFALFVALSCAVLVAPLVPSLPAIIKAFVQHVDDTSPGTVSLGATLMAIFKEYARAPVFMALATLGLCCWLSRRRYGLCIAFCLGLAVGVKTSLYAFRIVYLVPFALLMCVDAVHLLNRWPRVANFWLSITIVCGLLAGPAGWPFLDYPRLPSGLEGDLARAVGRGPISVFSPDFATYYIGRNLGWKQLGFANPSNVNDADMTSKALERSEAVVLREFDVFEPIQIGLTPYCLFCKYVLDRAREETSKPAGEKSWPARLGSQFPMRWHEPLELPGFDEVGRFGMIRVYRRKRFVEK